MANNINDWLMNVDMNTKWDWSFDPKAEKLKRELKLLKDNIKFEEKLRKEYPALREVWEKYQVVLNLVKQDNNNG